MRFNHNRSNTFTEPNKLAKSIYLIEVGQFEGTYPYQYNSISMYANEFCVILQQEDHGSNNSVCFLST